MGFGIDSGMDWFDQYEKQGDRRVGQKPTPMHYFFVWWDNSSGWFEADQKNFPGTAASVEEMLAKIPDCGYPVVVTGSREDDPNRTGTIILARR